MSPPLRHWLAVAFAGLLTACSDGADSGSAGDAVPTAAPDSQNTDAAFEVPRLVLLYLPCTVSTRYLAPYDPAVTYTPYLKSFSRDALVFERHQTEAGLSGIAYASILSGGESPIHGVYAHPQLLEGSVELIAERFASAGWDTWYWEAHGMASTRLNYGQGVGESTTFKERLIADQTDFQALVKRLRDDPSYRALVTTVFSVTHTPYRPDHLIDFCTIYPRECAPFEGETPDAVHRYIALHVQNVHELSYDFPAAVEELGLSQREVDEFAHVVERLYKSRIHKLDHMFGRVVEVLRENGLLDDSLIVFSADHGEVLDPDALFPWIHGHALAPEVLNVPLVVRGPKQGVPVGRYAGVTRSIDVFPTVAGLAGVPAPAPGPMRGVDLAPAIRREVPPPKLLAFSRTAFVREAHVRGVSSWKRFRALYPREDMNVVWVSVRDGDRVFKYRNMGDEGFRFQAFDLAADPDERKDLYDEAKPEHRAMSEELLRYRELLARDHAAREARGVENIPLDEQAELLRELGYIE